MSEGHGGASGDCGVSGYISCPAPIASAESAYVVAAPAPIWGQAGDVEITIPVRTKQTELPKK
jgi:hypothetical protein